MQSGTAELISYCATLITKSLSVLDAHLRLLTHLEDCSKQVGRHSHPRASIKILQDLVPWA